MALNVPAMLRKYWWAVLAAAGILCLPFVGWTREAMAAGLGLVYFIQQQRLRELELFHRLFREFNERYDGLNDGLQNVVSGRGDLSAEDRRLLTDYFNLCAEEYFYYSRGIVPTAVWRAWCRGMAAYLGERRIADYWKAEERTDSYYGFTHETVLAGAGLWKPTPPAASPGLPRAA